MPMQSIVVLIHKEEHPTSSRRPGFTKPREVIIAMGGDLPHSP